MSIDRYFSLGSININFVNIYIDRVRVNHLKIKILLLIDQDDLASQQI